MGDCQYPDCPTGTFHNDIRDDLKRIQTNQDKHLEIMSGLSGIVESVNGINKNIDRMEKAQSNLFTRVNALETGSISKRDVYSLAGLVTVIIVAVEFLLKWIIPAHVGK